LSLENALGNQKKLTTMLEETIVKESDQRFTAITQLRDEVTSIRADMKHMAEQIKKQPAASFVKNDPRGKQTDRSGGKKSFQNST